jgi:hypothetical protein
MPAFWREKLAAGESELGADATRLANDCENDVNAQPVEISGYAR